MNPRIGSLCTGTGALDLAVQAVLGGELAWYAEIEPAAVRLLEHRYPHVPNVGDLTGADWTSVEPIELFTAGWPCQPWSLAGRRKGAEDERAIWPFVADAVRVLRPRVVVLENVAAIVAAGELARAIADLSALGYVGCWLRLRASDVGAPHGRARIFIIAVPAADTTDVGHERGGPARRRRHGPADGGDAAPDPDRDPVREQPVPVERSGGATEPGRAGEVVADATSVRIPDQSGSNEVVPLVPEHRPSVGDRSRDPAEGTRELGRGAGQLVEWGIYELAIRRWERILERPVPAPTVLNTRGGPQLSPYLDEWLMGLPEGHVTGVPGLTVTQMLRLCGNGVVPLQAEVAIRWACDRLGVPTTSELAA